MSLDLVLLHVLVLVTFQEILFIETGNLDHFPEQLHWPPSSAFNLILQVFR